MKRLTLFLTILHRGITLLSMSFPIELHREIRIEPLIFFSDNPALPIWIAVCFVHHQQNCCLGYIWKIFIPDDATTGRNGTVQIAVSSLDFQYWHPEKASFCYSLRNLTQSNWILRRIKLHNAVFAMFSAALL